MFQSRTACPACESPHFRALWSAGFHQQPVAGFLQSFYGHRIDSDKLASQPFNICLCQQCELIFQQHILNDDGMRLLYSEWIDAAASLRKRQLAKSKLFRKYAGEAELIGRIINRPPHDINVVEFGMGWGYWSRTAMAFNYQVTGIELSPERVAHAASMGVKSVAQIDAIEKHSVDFIYANQVFEHLAEPLEIIKLLRDRLAANGVLLIRVPDGQGLAQTLQHRGWSADLQAIHPLEHINAFTRQSLLALGAKAGLTPKKVPLRLSCRSPANLWRSIKREYSDRHREPHVYFTPAASSTPDH